MNTELKQKYPHQRTPQSVVEALSYIMYEGLDNSQYTVYKSNNEAKCLYGCTEDVLLPPHLAVWVKEDRDDLPPTPDYVLNTEEREIIFIYCL